MRFLPQGRWWLAGIGAIVVGGGILGVWLPAVLTSQPYEKESRMSELVLSSSAFSQGGSIPPRYTCDGEDVSPPLSIAGVPEGTRSLVLIMDDPDAPMGTWDHWVVFNIPPTVREIPEGTEPEGTPGRNSWGRTGYGGPCPPDREHRYFFRLYALDTTLNLPEEASKEEVLQAMEGHILAQTELMGRYNRM